MPKLNTGFSKYSDDDLYHFATNVVTKVGANPKFSTLSAQLPPITTAAGTLETAMGQPAGPVRETAVAAARATLIPLLQNLAGALQIVPGVTDTDLAGSGYDMRQAATHTSAPPDVPTNVRLRPTGMSGELQVLFGAVARADFYEVQYTLDPNNGPWTLAPAFNSSRGVMLEGLTRGKDYYVQVRAVAAGQNYSPWSDLASAMAM